MAEMSDDPYHNDELIASRQVVVQVSQTEARQSKLTSTMLGSDQVDATRIPGRVAHLLLLVSLLLDSSAISPALSSQKPSNQVPSHTAPNDRHQLHQITPRAAFQVSSSFYKQDGSLYLAKPAAFALMAAGNQQHPDAPKLTPLSVLDRYQEGADLKLFCSASAPSASGRIQFEWRKNNGELLFSSSEDQPIEEPTNHRGSRAHLHISMMDDSSSMLRIGHLEAEDSGNYTCLARNQHGSDSSTVRVNVNVRLKWTREPPGEIEVRAGKSLQVECDASGQPAPLISWTSLKDHRTISSKFLRFDRTQRNDSGLYECRATASSGGEQLRKLIKLSVNGPNLIVLLPLFGH